MMKVFGPDSASSDNVDQTVSDFNCAIKTVGVELDKLRAYRYILCLRENKYASGKQAKTNASHTNAEYKYLDFYFI